jgi:hypothetical protein
MFGSPALEIVIGLVFLYFTLALICSTVNEVITTAVGLRAQFLQKGLMNLLSGGLDDEERSAAAKTLTELYRHPLMNALIRPGKGPDPEFDPAQFRKWWRKPRYPSYIPSRTFVSALTSKLGGLQETLADVEEAGRDVSRAGGDDELEKARKRWEAATAKVEKVLGDVDNRDLSEALLALYRTAGKDAAAFKHMTAQWYDDAMERVSGWYRRRIQVILFVIATFVVLLLNADTLATGRVLWRDDAVRAAVVTQAEQAASEGAEAADPEAAVRELDLPLGWNLTFGEGPTDLPNDTIAWLAKLAGLALTIVALMFGAPFWFDLLSKIVRVRATGAPPPVTDAVRKGEGEQSRAGPGTSVAGSA